MLWSAGEAYREPCPKSKSCPAAFLPAHVAAYEFVTTLAHADKRAPQWAQFCLGAKERAGGEQRRLQLLEQFHPRCELHPPQ